MSVEPLDDTNETVSNDVAIDPRIVELETTDGILIYDRANHQSWLQSDETVAVTDWR